MTWLWWLILGVLIGWIVEWVIDWLFWRRGNDDADSPLQARIQQLEAEFNRTRAEMQKLQSDLSAARAEAQQHQAALAPLETSLVECQQRYDQVQRELTTVKAQPAANTMIVPVEPSVPEPKLVDEHNTVLLGPEALAEARQADAVDRTMVLEAASEEHAADNRDNKTMLLMLEALTGEQKADEIRTPTVDPKATVLLSTEEVAAALAEESKTDEAETPALDAKATMLLSNEEVAQASTLLEEQAVGEMRERRDPLIDIDGIGPVYERKLFAAGIMTFAQLAALTPERVREIVNPERWQSVDAESWIAEARQFAERAEGSDEA